MNKVKSIYIEEYIVIDPDTGSDVHIEIYKDVESGGLFAIDSSFIEQISHEIPSPFNSNTALILDEN